MADAKPKAGAASKQGASPASDQAAAAQKKRLQDERVQAELGPPRPGKAWVLILKTCLIGGLAYYADDKVQVGESLVEDLAKRGEVKALKNK